MREFRAYYYDIPVEYSKKIGRKEKSFVDYPGPIYFNQMPNCRYENDYREKYDGTKSVYKI